MRCVDVRTAGPGCRCCVALVWDSGEYASGVRVSDQAQCVVGVRARGTTPMCTGTRPGRGRVRECEAPSPEPHAGRSVDSVPLLRMACVVTWPAQRWPTIIALHNSWSAHGGCARMLMVSAARHNANGECRQGRWLICKSAGQEASWFIHKYDQPTPYVLGAAAPVRCSRQVVVVV